MTEEQGTEGINLVTLQGLGIPPEIATAVMHNPQLREQLEKLSDRFKDQVCALVQPVDPTSLSKPLPELGGYVVMQRRQSNYMLPQTFMEHREEIVHLAKEVFEQVERAPGIHWRSRWSLLANAWNNSEHALKYGDMPSRINDHNRVLREVFGFSEVPRRADLEAIFGTSILGARKPFEKKEEIIRSKSDFIPKASLRDYSDTFQEILDQYLGPSPTWRQKYLFLCSRWNRNYARHHGYLPHMDASIRGRLSIFTVYKIERSKEALEQLFGVDFRIAVPGTSSPERQSVVRKYMSREVFLENQEAIVSAAREIYDAIPHDPNKRWNSRWAQFASLWNVSENASMYGSMYDSLYASRREIAPLFWYQGYFTEDMARQTIFWGGSFQAEEIPTVPVPPSVTVSVPKTKTPPQPSAETLKLLETIRQSTQTRLALQNQEDFLREYERYHSESGWSIELKTGEYELDFQRKRFVVLSPLRTRLASISERERELFQEGLTEFLDQIGWWQG